jgi:predicted lipoprotein with Yx(FWY)xxD motif/plastocyanin
MKARFSDHVPSWRLVWLPALIFVFVLSGCANQSAAQPQVVATNAAPTIAAAAETVTAVVPTVEAATTEVATAMPAATTAVTSTTATTSTTNMPSGPATVMIAKNDKLGDILTDEKGMTLYLFTKDTPNTSNCYDQCAQNWPPLLTSGAPVAGTGADAALLGTTTRKDGAVQVTYNGWPVYYWAKDQKPGDTTGQNVGGVWFVLNAKGDKVEAPAASSAAPAASSSATTVMISKNDKLGDILTDAKGMTLYLYTKDTPNTSTCYDKCAQNWPPVVSDGKPAAGAGADASLLGTTQRTDGKMQVTYNGWPVYYFIKDQKTGDASGQDVGGVWYVLNAKGEKVETAGASSAAPAAGAGAAAAGKTVSVDIKNFSFGRALTVPVGTTVVWTNQDDMAHTVTATGGAFDSGNIDKGQTFSFTFTKAGAYDYTCTIHPSMKGTVTVTG